MDDDEDVINVDMAGFFLNDKGLSVEFGSILDPKNIVLEFNNDEERATIERVLGDRNFWVQIVNALSAALQEKA